MGFFESADKSLNVLYNNEFVKQDIKTSKELVKIFLNEKIDTSYKFYLEGIFLGVTDRTTVHPYLVKVIPAEQKGFLNKLMGFQGGLIDYKPDHDFNLDEYLNLNWFPPLLESYSDEKKDLSKSKELYINNKINFFEYFIKRLKVYDAIKQKDHILHYENVDREKYIELLRSELRIIIR